MAGSLVVALNLMSRLGIRSLCVIGIDPDWLLFDSMPWGFDSLTFGGSLRDLQSLGFRDKTEI